MSHTPGPWTVDEGRTIRATWEMGEEVQIASMNITHWSTDPSHDDVPRNQSFNKRMRDESIYNVRLIAAAPELLKAAKEALSWFVDNGRGPNVNIDALNLQTAIAKAEGR